jgi:riboflavin biosynthesis pyrimidine reductase
MAEQGIELVDRYPRIDGLRVNFVASADGAVAVDGLSAGLSSPADKEVFRVLRMVCDALLVGAGTFRDENYRPLTLDVQRRDWRTSSGLSAYPCLVVFSKSLDLDPRHRALREAPVRPLIVTPADPGDHPLRRVADLIVAADPEHAIDGLRDKGMTSLLCEGGPGLLGSLSGADLVDEVCLTVAPLLAGPGADRIVTGTPHAPRRMRLVHAFAADDGTLLTRWNRAT